MSDRKDRGTDATKEEARTTDQVTRAIPNKLNLDVSTPLGRVNLHSSHYNTLNGITLALLLKGRDISTPAYTYWDDVHATRLPAYIQCVENQGLDGFINSRPLPLHKQKHRGRRRKPFNHYWLEPDVIHALGNDAQKWANKALAWWGVNYTRFPVSDAFRNSEGNA